jgi:hypothetical protein
MQPAGERWRRTGRSASLQSQPSAPPCRAVPGRAGPCRAVPCRAVPCRAVPCSAVQEKCPRVWGSGDECAICLALRGGWHGRPRGSRGARAMCLAGRAELSNRHPQAGRMDNFPLPSRCRRRARSRRWRPPAEPTHDQSATIQSIPLRASVRRADSAMAAPRSPQHGRAFRPRRAAAPGPPANFQPFTGSHAMCMRSVARHTNGSAGITS